MKRTRAGWIRTGTEKSAAVAASPMPQWISGSRYFAAYAGWTSAQSCADDESKADSISGVAHSAFGKCGESAQNECPGWPGPPDTLIVGCLKMMWAEGPGTPFSAHGHYINMSSTAYKSVACGFYKTASGSYWAVQDFR